MIDQNGLMEIINNAAPLIATSPVLVKLIGCVTDIIKTLYTPALTFKKGKAEVDVEFYREQKNRELFQNQTFTLYEINKLKNFANSVYFAAEELNNNSEEEVYNENVDFDWVMRFFDAVGNISNDDLQRLWGKILAGEMKQPGACSLRTLDIVRNMSQQEAETFVKLCRYVVESGDSMFIMNNGFMEYDGTNERSRECIKRDGLVYSTHILPLIDCGLFSAHNQLSYSFDTGEVLYIHSDTIVCFVWDETKQKTLQIDPYFLTSSGIDLFNIIRSNPSFKEDREYKICCYKELKQQCPQLDFAAFNRLADDTHDDTDLLY